MHVSTEGRRSHVHVYEPSSPQLSKGIHFHNRIFDVMSSTLLFFKASAWTWSTLGGAKLNCPRVRYSERRHHITLRWHLNCAARVQTGTDLPRLRTCSSWLGNRRCLFCIAMRNRSNEVTWWINWYPGRRKKKQETFVSLVSWACLIRFQVKRSRWRASAVQLLYSTVRSVMLHVKQYKYNGKQTRYKLETLSK